MNDSLAYTNRMLDEMRNAGDGMGVAKKALPKTNTMKMKWITFYLSLITITSWAQTDIKTKDYPVDDFSKIFTHGGGNLNISYADRPTLQIQTDKQCMESVAVAVSSNVLSIKIKNSKTRTCPVTIHIGVPILSELVQTGGGNIILNKGVKPTTAFWCKINGGGNMNLAELAVDSLYASIEGGGNMRLNAKKTLEVKIDGGGLIEYEGDAIVKSDVAGGGTIRKR